MGFFTRKKNGVIDSFTINDFNNIPDDNSIKEVVIKDSDELEERSASEIYKDETKSRPLPQRKIRVEYNKSDNSDKNEEVFKYAQGSEYASGYRFKLSVILIKKYIDDKLLSLERNSKEFNLGNILAGIKYIDYHLSYIIGQRLEQDEKQLLLSKATTYILSKGFNLVSVNVQTKGKLYETKEYIKKLKSFSKEELIELLEL